MKRPRSSDVVHGVVVVVEIKYLIGAEDFADGVVIALVGGNGFGIPAGTGHIVVGDADEVRFVAFVDQFEGRTSGKDGDVVGVGLN
jgi:hypothetical protein